MSGIASMGALMAGWASNNKYALLGGFRVVAQLMSYEIPLAFSLLAVVIFAGTMGTDTLARTQGGTFFGVLPAWNILVMPFAALIFFISALAEGERAPFDLLEAESEIVAGPNIEYSGMKFAWFYLQFFVNSLLLACIFATVFLGGWQGPFVDQYPILGIVYFTVKSFIVLFLFMWVRATYPRLRIDQMMTFCWKVLVPVSLVVVLISAVGAKVTDEPQHPGVGHQRCQHRCSFRDPWHRRPGLAPGSGTAQGRSAWHGSRGMTLALAG